MHKKVSAGVFSEHSALLKHADSFAINQIASPDQAFAFDINFLLIESKETLDAFTSAILHSPLLPSTALYFISPHNSKVPLPTENSLPFKLPKQTFLNFGPIEFEIDDIELEHAFSVLEYDVNFNRVDPD